MMIKNSRVTRHSSSLLRCRRRVPGVTGGGCKLKRSSQTDVFCLSSSSQRGDPFFCGGGGGGGGKKDGRRRIGLGDDDDDDDNGRDENEQFCSRGEISKTLSTVQSVLKRLGVASAVGGALLVTCHGGRASNRKGKKGALEAIAAETWDVEEDKNVDDLTRVKRLLTTVLKDVSRLHDKVDSYEGMGGSHSFKHADFQRYANTPGVEIAIHSNFVVDDVQSFENPAEFFQSAGIESRSRLDLTLKSEQRGGNRMTVELTSANLDEAAKVELKSILVESSLNQSTMLKFSPFGCNASDLILDLHPLRTSGLSKITQGGCNFLSTCRGMLVSSSWTKSRVGISALHSFNFPESQKQDKPTHTIGQVLLKVVGNFVLSLSSKVSSSYQKLDIEQGLAARKSLGYSHALSYCLGGAVSLNQNLLVSGWLSSPNLNRHSVDEWWLGITNLANEESGFSFSLSSPSTSKKVQAEAFMSYKVAGSYFVSPGMIFFPESGKKVLMLNTQIRV